MTSASAMGSFVSAIDRVGFFPLLMRSPFDLPVKVVAARSDLKTSVAVQRVIDRIFPVIRTLGRHKSGKVVG
jgi:hypothetical protein